MGDAADLSTPQLPESGGSTSSASQKLENTPFQTQLDYLSQSQFQGFQQNAGQYVQHAFDMGAMAGALPPNASMGQRSSYAPGDGGQILSSPTAYFQPSQQMSYHTQRSPFPPQQQQFYSTQYGSGPTIHQMLPRQQPYPMQTQIPFSPIDPYSYGLNPAQFSPVDARFGAQPQFGFPGGLPPDFGQFARRGSTDSAPIPSFPRGPPRKPKQSGHALWVGNLPPATLVVDLKDHFSKDATDEIESVFLIAKSNCAFVNYRTEAACVAAVHRFHDGRFHGVRLVCRLRRATASSANAAVSEESSLPVEIPSQVEDSPEEPSSPTIARSSSGQDELPPDATLQSPDPNVRVAEKYFIVKSLTAQDLEASVRNQTWATQSHNETALNKAYEQVDNVYLIFSANKSGEYFGYARMSSPISGEPVSLSSLPAPTEYGTDSAGSPQSIPTPATATAPRGRIIDDSARGTIFWEADRDGDDDEDSTERESGNAGAPGTGQDWGRQFKIEWVSTNRLPFYRTRGLRNPWNANREVKIARDGTELEPSVGRRLTQMFHRPNTGPTGSATSPVPPAGMSFR